jgi:hypothetical protein
MIPAPPSYRDDRVPRDLRRLLPLAAPNLLVVAWRWRYEIALVAGLSAGLTAAIISVGAVPIMAAVAVVALAIVCWPRARRFTLDRAWCIITPHRVRAGCAQGLIYSSEGKIPVILWTSHQPFGERVLLWCRAGTSADDFVSARAVLTAACWARDIAVFLDPHRTQLVTLDVIRRPLGDLTSDFEGHRTADPGGEPPVWPGGQDTQPLRT